MARQRLSHLLAVAAEAVAQLETAGIEPLRVQPNRQGIAANEWPPVATKNVRREPRRIVPPMCVFEPSGMKITTGCGVSGFISVEFAPFQPRINRAYSITATCMPAKAFLTALH